jgi:Fe2+ transport system protein FeoA
LVDRLVGRPEQVHRLEEIGLRAGTHIEVLQSGSPCIIRLASQRLCFRENELMGVLVRPLPLQAAAQVG